MTASSRSVQIFAGQHFRLWNVTCCLKSSAIFIKTVRFVCQFRFRSLCFVTLWRLNWVPFFSASENDESIVGEPTVRYRTHRFDVEKTSLSIFCSFFFFRWLAIVVSHLDRKYCFDIKRRNWIGFELELKRTVTNSGLEDKAYETMTKPLWTREWKSGFCACWPTNVSFSASFHLDGDTLISQPCSIDSNYLLGALLVAKRRETKRMAFKNNNKKS